MLRVIGPVGEGQVLGVGETEVDFQTLGPGALGAPLQKGGNIVGRGHAGAAAGGGQGGVAVAGGHVEHLLVPADVAGFGQLFADQLQGGADHGVVAAGPGGLLAGLQGVQVDGDGVHGQVSFSRSHAGRCLPPRPAERPRRRSAKADRSSGLQTAFAERPEVLTDRPARPRRLGLRPVPR